MRPRYRISFIQNAIEGRYYRVEGYRRPTHVKLFSSEQTDLTLSQVKFV
jgi:hypothetical protein